MTRRKWRRFGGLVVLWLIALTVLLRLVEGRMGRGDVVGYALISAFAIYAISKLHVHVLPQLRQMPLYVAASVVTLLYMGAIVVSSFVGIVILVGASSGSLSNVWSFLVRFFEPGWPVTLGIPFLIAISVSFLAELSRRLGPRRIVNLLLGRYRNPREEVRLFLLIDLVGSTPLAEFLGSVQYSRMLREFFSDLTDPVLDTDGEVVEYVGDEAIITWRFRPGRASDALRCFTLLKDRIEARSDHYMSEYGQVPRFKGALHAGPVVSTEVGQLNTQVVYHGDALNTASRVLGECNRLEAQLLVTESVVPSLAGTDWQIEDLGRVKLKGKGEALGLARLMVTG